MKNKIKKISVVIVILMIFLFLSYILYSPISDIFISDNRLEYTFNCDPTATPDILCQEGCKCGDGGSSIWCHRHTYLFNDPLIVSSMWGEFHIVYGGDYINQVYLEFLKNGNWVLERTFEVIGFFPDEGTHGFSINFAPLKIQGFRFNFGTYGSEYAPYLWLTRGSLLVESPEIQQCFLRIIVEEYLDGPPAVNQEVNVKSYPSGNVDLIDYTDDNGIVSFTLDYGEYEISLDLQSKIVNLDNPIHIEMFTLRTLPSDISFWIILLIILIIVIISALLIYYYIIKKKKKKGKKYEKK